MGFRTRTAVGLATALAGLLMIVASAGTAAAYDFPSTNDANRTGGASRMSTRCRVGRGRSRSSS